MSPIVLSFRFERGRFHGTTWRANPFDDPEGEWPPSPWRVVRALIARACQWAREEGVAPNACDVEGLARGLCTSRWSYAAPGGTRRGPTLKQYQSVGYRWNPQGKKDDRRYGPHMSLVPDTSWLTETGDGPTVWVLEGGSWTDSGRELLSRAVERLTYLGRAESVCEATVGAEAPDGRLALKASREEVDRVGAGTVVRVLAPKVEASLAELCVAPADMDGGLDAAPPGARWMYTWRATGRTQKRAEPKGRRIEHEPRSLIQLALGFHVPPKMYAWTRLTHRFRGAVLKKLLGLLEARGVDELERKKRCAFLGGKDESGQPLRGHRHAHWLLFSDETDPAIAVPSRLVVWREEPFDSDEVTAILAAAEDEIGWGPKGKSSPWRARAVPLDRRVEPPAGLSGSARVWESATPWVPPRMGIRTNGRVRNGLAPDEQLAAELKARGLGEARVEWLDTEDVHFFAVRVPSSRRDAASPTRGGHRGYRVRLTFEEPISGPLALGHSSHFGLGWFRPVD